MRRILGSILTLVLMVPAPASAYFRLNAQLTQTIIRASSSSKPMMTSAQKLRKEILDLVNAERKKRGLPALTANAILERAAQGHADDMLKRTYFSHTSPEKHEAEHRIRAAGYFAPPCQCKVRFSFGENIAKGQKTAKEVMAGWMRSKMHRDNILRSDFKELGVGIAGNLWVQNFGSVTILR